MEVMKEKEKDLQKNGKKFCKIFNTLRQYEVQFL